MSIHKKNNDNRKDDEFLKGDLLYLVEGNQCRLLDGRRTPGTIQELDIQKAMFVFLIGDYEDKGKTWTLYAEEVTKFQFKKNAKVLSNQEIEKIQKQIDHYHKPFQIDTNNIMKKETLHNIEALKNDITQYLFSNNIHSPFIDTPSIMLQELLSAYMTKHNFLQIEQGVSKQMVINPNSGELAKAIAIALARLGLQSYSGTILRTTLFDEDMLIQYLIHRIAFVQVLFERPFTVYRGMSSESHFITIPRTFLSWTDSLDVAKAFTEFDDPRYKTVYLLKKEAMPKDLFMTHYETKAFHETYQEKEVILFHNDSIII